jgi:hypothetical protein
VFAGYWRPTLVTRAWVACFFLVVRLQRYVRVVPRIVSGSEGVRASQRATA